MSKRREPAQLARDRRRIAAMYLRGRLQVEIAEELKIEQSTVSRDLKALQEEWRVSTLVDFNEAKARELARIDELERVYWAEWEQSRQQKKSTVREQVDTSQGARKKAQLKEEERLGDPRYLQGVQWCIERRCRILGIDAPEKHQVTGKDGAALFPVDDLIASLRAAHESLSHDSR